MSLPLLVYFIGIYENIYQYIGKWATFTQVIFWVYFWGSVIWVIAAAIYSADGEKLTLPPFVSKKGNKEDDAGDKDKKSNTTGNAFIFVTSWIRHIVCRSKIAVCFIILSFIIINAANIFLPNEKLFYSIVGAYFVEEAVDSLDKEAIKEQLKILPTNALKAINEVLERKFDDAIEQVNEQADLLIPSPTANTNETTR